MCKFISLIVLLFFASANALAQHTMKAWNVSLIAYNSDASSIDFYKKVGRNKYQIMYLENNDEKSKEYGEIETVHLFFETDKDDDAIILDELKQSYKNIIFVNEIRPTKYADFEGKTFDLKISPDKENEKNIYEDEEKYDKKTIVQFLSKYLCKKEDLEFRDGSYRYGFGVYENSEVDTLTRWRPVDNEYFTPLVMDFGNGRKIYLFNDEEDIEMALLPLENSNCFLEDNEGTLYEIEQINNNYEKFWGYQAEEFLAIHSKGKKKKLVNIYDKNILKKSYDTLLISNYFVIGKNKKSVDIYDASLNKRNFGKVKNAYPYYSGLEVLNEKGATYYNSEGESVSKISVVHLVCGTRGYASYLVEKDSLTHQYSINYRYSHTGYRSASENKYILTDRTMDEELMLVEDLNFLDWNENFAKIEAAIFVRVEKGNKFGLFVYDLNETEDEIDKKKSFPKSRVYKDKYLQGSVVLPIEYTHIELKNGLLFIEKDGKIGIFPHHKTPIYDKITQKTASFYEVIKNAKKYWLDVKTMKEFD